MWKKKDNEPIETPSAPTPEPRQTKPTEPRSERAVIGPTVRIRGEISGEEDLVVQGNIDGKIEVKGRGVIVGKAGKIKANIHARAIRVEGRVRGDLFGEQEIVIEASGDVEGNLVAPSVRLENGSRFKGSIDMEQPPQPVAAPGQGGQVPKKTLGGSMAEGSAKSTSASSSQGPGRSPMRS